MFKIARLQLTLWYLLIIMIISLCFSAVIYNILTFELDRFASLQRARMESKLQEQPYENKIKIIYPPLPTIEQELIEETKYRLLMRLAYVNCVIFIIAGGLGYFLAERTLQPIQKMHNQQRRFISDSSHELRTPLTALKTILEISLRDTHLTLKDSKQVINESIEEVNRLQYLTDNLLELSQYDLQQRSIRKKINSKSAIDKAINSLKPLIKQKNIHLDLKVTSTKINAYEDELVKLFIILLENSIKYSNSGTTISIKTEVKNNFLIFTFRDEGEGISKKDVPYIFDRFYRSDTARTKEKTNGYGLGLSIAKEIVQIHQGTISVKSALKKGTIFTVTLPITI